MTLEHSWQVESVSGQVSRPHHSRQRPEHSSKLGLLTKQAVWPEQRGPSASTAGDMDGTAGSAQSKDGL